MLELRSIVNKTNSPAYWCPPLCEGDLSARSLVSRLPENKRELDELYSALYNTSNKVRGSILDILPDNAPGSCGCNLSALSDSYEWADLFDQSLTIYKPTSVYQLPDFNSGIVRVLLPGDQIQIYSYLNVNGVTWLQYYTPPLQYPDWIPLNGTPGGVNTIPVQTINTIFNPQQDIPNLLTTEEKEQQNADTWDKAGDLLKNVLIGAGALILVNKLL